LEEDDAFEEFEPEDWGKDEYTADDAQQQQQWMDNWDDDADDDFTKNLRQELIRHGTIMSNTSNSNNNNNAA
jgi:hypothetical protein